MTTERLRAAMAGRGSGTAGEYLSASLVVLGMVVAVLI